MIAAVRQLPTIQRSIVLENRISLLRRWRLARSEAIHDPRQMNRFFPKQRALLDLLAIVDREEVEQMASSPIPLFRLHIRCIEFHPESSPDQSIADPLERAAVDEAFLALSSRLDAIKTSVQQACLLFDMTYGEAAWLSRFCPHELKLLARDPSLILAQAATDEFFAASATRKLSPKEHLMFCTVSRRTHAGAI